MRNSPKETVITYKKGIISSLLEEEADLYHIVFGFFDNVKFPKSTCRPSYFARIPLIEIQSVS